MGFLLFVGLCVVIWLLWNICRNTNDALDKQTAIQYEIVSLEKRMEELLDKLAEQSASSNKSKGQSGKKPEAPVETVAQKAELVEDENDAEAVNVNSATLKTLTSLPKIGNALAQRVIEGRPYATGQDLLKVKGVSKDILTELRSKINF